MRVLHVIPSVGAAHGGPSVAVRLMAQASVRAGAHVDIATTNINDAELLRVPLETMHDEDGVGVIYFAPSTRAYTYSQRLAAWLNDHVADYDVVHAHALFTHATAAAARATTKRAVPLIIRPLGTLARYGMTQHAWLKKLSWLLVEKRILSEARAVHFTSIAERDEAARLGGDWRSEVVPLGIDVGEFDVVRDKSALRDVWADADRRVVLLFLSRIHPKKRLDLVLRAFAEFSGTLPAALIVAGSGGADYVQQMRQLAEDLHIAPHVFWAGHVSGAAKHALLRAADAFVLPSVNENFGIAVVEALASGLPAVVSDGVAIHSEVANAGAGVVTASEPRALANAFARLADPAERRAMAERARGLAESAFSLDAMRHGLTAMYERAVA